MKALEQSQAIDAAGGGPMPVDLPMDYPRISVEFNDWERKPSNSLLAIVVLTFGLFWLLTLTATSVSPPADNIEQMLWVQSLQWGYYKHPPLPTWLYWIPVKLFGPQVWTTYLMAALANIASIALFWRLLRQLRGPRFAYIGVLAALCITYYNARFTTYNHNTVLMLVSTASAALCWQACTTGRLRWWIGLGVALGLGMLTKYQIAVSMASVLAFWLHQRGWRDVALRRGLLLAMLTASLMFAPHVSWLREHDFGPVGYAIESSLGAHLSMPERVADGVNWLADQLLNRALPAWLLLITIVVLQRQSRRVERTARTGMAASRVSRPTPPRADAARALILIWGLLPLGFMPLVGLVAGSHLHLPWGTPHLLFAVPAVMEVLRSRVQWSSMALRHVTAVFLVVQGTLLLLSIGTSAWGPAVLRDHHWRSFDSAALARQLEPALRKALAGRRLVAVSGPEVLAAALAHALPERPVVLIDGQLDRSPWVAAATLARGPMLQLQVGTPLPDGVPVGGAFADTWWRLSWPPKHLQTLVGTTPAAVQASHEASLP
ncbi:MAG: glycosyltransferase family 39 protein [Rhodoferax sp.]|nr:glycosyltransferase family 39 protein [Rhodoferax sp.]